jgi:hypothetical protein
MEETKMLPVKIESTESLTAIVDEEEFRLLNFNAMEGDQVVLQEGPKTVAKRKKNKGGFRKAPQAPRRFKSPYILFSISKMAEYKSSSKNVQVTVISRRIAQEWKTLSDVERGGWDQTALQDKLRYNAEKSLYTGPWQVPSKRARKVRTILYHC